MKKVVQRFLYCIGRITGWRWLSLMAGVALIAASCSGKDNNSAQKKDTIRKPDSMRVTCYEPMADTSVINNRPSNAASKEDVMNLKDTSVQGNEVPIQKCYVPIKPLE